MNLTEKIDLSLLKTQKQELLELIWEKDNSNLWGIIYLLDHIQDELEKESA